MHINKSRIHIVVLFLVLGILLIASILFSKSSDNQDLKNLSYNPYVKKAPEVYSQFLDKFHNEDSTFFTSINESYATRELIIAAKSKSPKVKLAKFNVNIYLENESEVLKIDMVNNGVIYTHNKEEYILFKTKLPFTEISKVVIKQNPIRGKQKPWSDSLINPFKSVSEYTPEDINFKTLQTPQANVYSPVLFKLLTDYGIQFIPKALRVKDTSVVDSYTEWNAFALQNNHSIIEVKKPNTFWQLVNKRDKTVINGINIIGKKASIIETQLNNYLDNSDALESVFDLKKITDFNAIMSLLSSNCNNPLYFKFNEDTKKLEPFFVNSSCLGTQLKFMEKPMVNNLAFIKSTIASLNEISSINTDEVVKSIPMFEEKLALINKFHPKKIFDIELLKTNQKVINKSLNPSSMIEARLLKISKTNLSVQITNLTSYPVIIEELSFRRETKSICKPDDETMILSRATDTIEFKLPRSFENLFVSKKSKQTGFRLEKHIYDLFIGVSVDGLNNPRYAPILPYKAREKVEVDLFRNDNDIKSNKNIIVNDNAKTIMFSNKEVIINSEVVIPKGYRFVVKQGTKIDMVNNGVIISNSPVFFRGTKAEPIEFMSSDNKGQGLLVMADGENSVLNHVSFDNLTNPKYGNWNVTGAVTFYESPVKLSFTSISNNKCEDALNIIRTTFRMSNCKISQTQSDAFDGDFVTGSIEMSTFEDLGNDAIDISGSDLTIVNVIIKNAGDKGLSAGEDSKMTVRNVEIYNSEIAVAGKDLSIVDINELKIDNTKLGFTAFQKKPEYGPSNITVKNLMMSNVETNYLIESSSSLMVDGEVIKTSLNVKDRMYGVEFGRSSAETRNSQ